MSSATGNVANRSTQNRSGRRGQRHENGKSACGAAGRCATITPAGSIARRPARIMPRTIFSARRTSGPASIAASRSSPRRSRSSAPMPATAPTNASGSQRSARSAASSSCRIVQNRRHAQKPARESGRIDRAHGRRATTPHCGECSLSNWTVRVLAAVSAVNRSAFPVSPTWRLGDSATRVLWPSGQRCAKRPPCGIASFAASPCQGKPRATSGFVPGSVRKVNSRLR